jgi:arginine/lysine/ornithine decarboxylase
VQCRREAGDLLIHEGSAKHAQKFAAKVFNADKTYFVLNGTSAANKVVTNALLTRGDLVLFDRNNHKSNHHGALIQAGATPVILKRRVTRLALLAGLMSTVLMMRTCGSDPRGGAGKSRRARRSAWRSSSLAPTTARSTTPVR